MLCEGAYRSQCETAQDDDLTSWEAVFTVLLRSIYHGIFFDRKYWARHSKAGDALKPIYFSSRIMDDVAQEFAKCTSKLIHWYAKALIAISGKIRQRSRPSDKGS